ncbi:MAG: hypothetical protein U5R30_21555 [Deltaproteobacteria bacterium]|nr:hypothetical protein [Deltaproteobacteria bacterium]
MKRRKLSFPIAFGADDRIDGYFVEHIEHLGGAGFRTWFFAHGRVPDAKVTGYFRYGRHPQGRCVDSHQVEAEPGFRLKMVVK